MKPTFFATPASFRSWLEKHHATKTELLVGFYKKHSGRPSITWPESVDEALCFGWIDGVRRLTSQVAVEHRCVPRENWLPPPRSVLKSGFHCPRICLITR